jgi:hypothetical protein
VLNSGVARGSSVTLWTALAAENLQGDAAQPPYPEHELPRHLPAGRIASAPEQAPRSRHTAPCGVNK